jgi:hypothetical protein
VQGYGPPNPWGPQFAPPAPTDGFAIAGLIFGIVPVLGGLLGIVFGLIGRSRTSRTGQPGKRMATTGAVLGSVWLIVLIAAATVGAAIDGTSSAFPTDYARPLATAAPVTPYTGGDVSLDDVKVGDCLTELPLKRVLTIGITLCPRPHLGEVFDLYDLPGASYPGDAQVERLVLGRCRKVLPVFVHAAPGRTGYGIYYLIPTAESWAEGSHVATCILTDPHDKRFSGEARGKGPHRVPPHAPSRPA